MPDVVKLGGTKVSWGICWAGFCGARAVLFFWAVLNFLGKNVLFAFQDSRRAKLHHGQTWNTTASRRWVKREETERTTRPFPQHQAGPASRQMPAISRQKCESWLDGYEETSLTPLQTGIVYSKAIADEKVATPPVPDDDHQSYSANKSKSQQLFLSPNQQERRPPCGGKSKTPQGFLTTSYQIMAKKDFEKRCTRSLGNLMKENTERYDARDAVLVEQCSQRKNGVYIDEATSSIYKLSSVNFELFKMRSKPCNTWATPGDTAVE
jgi:hypothetical protein